ncbi:methyltransferase domain-containing protein [Nonomuraea sp. AD125B]|uniref:methyltransferase domain-containing protein n=1 Tax=Nonomuraea sp. AD125B TaxID=3242897 RepID=UPI003527A4E4
MDTTAAPLDSQNAARPFDALGMTYEHTYSHLPEQLEALEWLAARLPAGAAVLDIGSGTGRPAAERLTAAGCAVTGIDVSATMVELARAHVPGATFAQLDVRQLPDRPGSWDAVCAFFPLLQMSRADLDATLARIACWLAPGGLFAFATVPFDAENTEIEWMGQRVRATSYPAETYLERLRDAGLQIVHHSLSTFHPQYPGMDAEEHLFIYARRPHQEPVPAHAAVPAHPLTGPYPHPRAHARPHPLPQDGWLAFEERLDRGDIDAVVRQLDGNTHVADIGGGSGALVRAIAARVGSCLTVEPHADREDAIRGLNLPGVRVLAGSAESLPLQDASVEAVTAAWILHYCDDPDTAVAEMARILDRSHPHAKAILVQGAPDNQVVGLWNQVCAPLLGLQPDHQGFLLTRAARVLAGRGLQDIAFHRVRVRLRFPEQEVTGKAHAAADVLAGLWEADAAERRRLHEALLPSLAEHFAGGTDELSDDGVMLIARPWAA